MKKNVFILIIILSVAAFLRFFNLMHDAPYFFNPDERNMASAITQLRLPANIREIPICLISQFLPQQLDAKRYTLYANSCNLNPHFFAYGQFPLYLAYVSDQITQSFWQVPFNGTRPESHGDPGQARMTIFPSAIFWLRFWSALSSTLTVLLVYLITTRIVKSQAPNTKLQINLKHQIPKSKQFEILNFNNWNLFGIWNLNFGHYATLLAAFTPGLIQSAHFGTTESLLTFFFMASVYLSIRLINIPLSVKSKISNGKNDFLNKFREIATVSFDKLRIPRNDIVLLSLVIGLAIGSKLTGIFFLIPPVASLIVRTIELFKLRRKTLWIDLFENLKIAFLPARQGLFLIISSIIVFILASPYNLINIADFRSAVFGYESDVAMGKYEAFYTRQFVGTTPILFQAEKIFPYALGWPIFISGIVGLILMSLKLIFWTLRIYRGKMKQFYNAKMIQKDNCNIVTLLIVSFLIYLLPNAFLFAKWTRFMTPIFPFFSIFAGYLLSTLLSSRPQWRDLSLPFVGRFLDPPAGGLGMTLLLRDSSTSSLRNDWNDRINKLGYWVIGLLVFIGSITPGLAYMSIYTNEDSRVTASKWIYQNIPNNSYILSETANVIDIPLGLSAKDQRLKTNGYKVISFDFYHLDENPLLFTNLINHLEKSDYIFIPSRRIFANYTRLPARYPLITKYYQLLYSGRLGYEKVKEINSYPGLEIGPPAGGWKLEIGDEQSEETYTVFDHPVIRIFKKVKPFTKEQYRMLFEN